MSVACPARSDRLEDAARAAVGRYRAEIRDYTDLDAAVPHGDVTLITLETMRALLADVERRELGQAPDEFREDTCGA